MSPAYGFYEYVRITNLAESSVHEVYAVAQGVMWAIFGYIAARAFDHIAEVVLDLLSAGRGGEQHYRSGSRLAGGVSMTKKKVRGRPAKPYPKIPDTYENIIKALVRPAKKGEPPSRD